MSFLRLPPEFVAREKESEFLRQKLEKAKQGQGSTVFIAGESGVGKTRLVEELISVALQNGFQVFKAQCFLESLGPYAPITAVLKEARLEHLLVDTKPPRIEGLYGVTKGGVIVAKFERQEAIDSDIFVSMITAVEIFVKDSVSLIEGREVAEQIGHMGYGNFHITNVPGKNLNLVAVTTGRENEYLISDLRETLQKIEDEFSEAIKGCKGERIAGIEEILAKLVLSGKYEGIDYAEEDARIRQANLFENVARGLQRKAEQKPVLIFIDDLQWCDPSSLALLHYIARNTRKTAVLILGTYRSEEVLTTDEGRVHQLAEVVERMQQEGLIETIELKRLELQECNALVSSVLGTQIDPELSEKIYRETEGNTFFVLEILKNLYEEKQLYFDRGRWHYNLETMQLPKRIYEVVARRLQRLRKEERELLDAASVLGEEFTSELLAKVVERPRIHVVKNLVSIERNHRLLRVLKKKYRFEHGKFREVVYGELPEELKTLYHLKAGEALEEEYRGASKNVIGDIVYHYMNAGAREKVCEYGLLAARAARKRFANEESIGFYRKVLEAAGEGEQHRELRLQVLEELADVLEVAGKYDDALEMLNLSIALHAGNQLETGKCYRKRCEIHIMKGEYEKALEEGKKAEQALASIPEGELELARVWSAKGVIWMRKGDYRKAIEFQKRANEVFKKFGAEKEQASVCHRIGTCYSFLGEYEKALGEFVRALNIREKIKDLRGLAATYNNIGTVYDDRGEYEKALEYYTKSLELYERIEDVRGIAFAYNNIGVVAKNRGEYERALSSYTKSLMLKEKIGDIRGIAIAYTNIGDIFRDRGEYEKALEYHRKSLELYEKMGDVEGIAWAYNTMGSIYREIGNYERAEELLAESLEIGKRIGNVTGIVQAYTGIGELALDRGDYGVIKIWGASI
ncbi:MAG: tetratricopeptide repeat protein [Thermoplasmata archaeon]